MKKNAQISDMNEALKGENVIDTPQWRSIHYLGDLRNLCAHDKTPEPTADQVEDLLAGVAKVTKTIVLTKVAGLASLRRSRPPLVDTALPS